MTQSNSIRKGICYFRFLTFADIFAIYDDLEEPAMLPLCLIDSMDRMTQLCFYINTLSAGPSLVNIMCANCGRKGWTKSTQLNTYADRLVCRDCFPDPMHFKGK